MVEILLELAPNDNWVSIWGITESFNNKLQLHDQNKISGVAVGNILRLLGLKERKRIRLATCCFIRRDILRQYKNEAL